jgi:hypothetical protein
MYLSYISGCCQFYVFIVYSGCCQFYIFIVYFSMLSISQFVQHEVIELLVDSKWERELKGSGHNQIRGTVSAIFRVTEEKHNLRQARQVAHRDMNC